jgi:hypothetical protein
MTVELQQRAANPTYAHAQHALRELMVASLDSAIRAPSTHNTQPWIFGIEEMPAAITLHADTDRALAIADPTGRELFISCGTVLHHLRVALAARGRSCRVERLPDPSQPNFVARVTLGDPIPITEEALALEQAIQRRHTDNGPFSDEPIRAELLDALVDAAQAEGAQLIVLQEEDARARVADLVAIADRVQHEDPLFRDELAGWLRSSRERSSDGITIEGPVGLVLPWVVRTFDRGDGVAVRDRALIVEGSPVIVLLTTSTDTKMDWIRAGEALSAVLLRSTAAQLSTSYLAQVVEVEATHRALSDLADHQVVQVVLRMGHGHGGRKSARRPVRDMLRE